MRVRVRVKGCALLVRAHAHVHGREISHEVPQWQDAPSRMSRCVQGAQDGEDVTQTTHHTHWRTVNGAYQSRLGRVGMDVPPAGLSLSLRLLVSFVLGMPSCWMSVPVQLAHLPDPT